MPKMSGHDPRRLIHDLTVLGDMVNRGEARVRHWNVTTNTRGYETYTFDITILGGTSNGVLPLKSPEAKLTDLLSKAIYGLVTGRRGSSLHVGVTDLQSPHDPTRNVQDIFVEFIVSSTPSYTQASNVAKQQFQALAKAMNMISQNTKPMIDFDPFLEMPPLKDKGISIEPIVAYRDYTIDQTWSEGPILTSRNSIVWHNREKHYAICNKGGGIFGHDAPHENCECGVYAFMNPDHPDMRNSHSYVWAEVYLWGNVLLCESGYRAQYAYPKTLFIRDTGTQIIRWVADKLQEAYGVPCLLMTGEKKKLSHQMDDALARILSGGEGVKS